MRKRNNLVASLIITLLITASIFTIGSGKLPNRENGSAPDSLPYDGDGDDIYIIHSICEPGITVEKYVKWDCTPPYKKNVTADIGDWVTFKLYVNNTGGTPLDIYVRDELPLGLTYVAGSTDIDGISVSQEEPEISGNYLYWNFTNDVPSETYIVITFRADVDECGEHINVANVTGEYVCQEKIYDEDTAIVYVECPPGEEGISVEKYVKWDCTPPYKKNVTADIGDWVTFKLYVNNTGGTPLDIYVRDELPLGLTYVAGSTDIDGISVSQEEPEISGNYLYWNFTNDVPSETYIVITFRADVDECGEHINVANVTGEYVCQEKIYDEDTAIVWVSCEPDIDIDKKASLDGVNWVDDVIETFVGDIVFFKINVSNTGDQVLDGVVVIDTLPSLLTFNDDADPENILYNESDNEIRWFFSHILVDEYRVITFSATVTDVGIDENIVTTTTCGGPDAQDSVTIDASGGMHVEKLVSLNGKKWLKNVTAEIGDTVRFLINITYHTEDHTLTLFDFHIKDTLPDELAYADDANPEEPEISGQTLYWNFTDDEDFMLNGDFLTISFNATVAGDGEMINIVNVTARECSDNMLYGEDQAVVYVEPGPSIRCEKTVQAKNGSWVDEINANFDDIVRFNITISNIGYNPIYGICVLDTLPSILTYVEDSAVIKYNGDTIVYSDCRNYDVYDEENNTLFFDNLNFCTGEYLSPGENISLLFDSEVIAEGIGINLANVTACMCNQCDWQKCSDTATVNATIPIPELIADASGSPRTIYEGESVSFTGSATGGIPPYQWDWDFDDGTSHSTQQNPTHQFNNKGQYTVTLTVTDDNDKNDTDTVVITVNENLPPNKPNKPTGKINGEKEVEYTYSTSATDPYGDQLRYQWDWGDGKISEWSGLYNSGATATEAHTWEEKGSYEIKVRAKDPDGLISDWSDPLAISMPKNKLVNSSLLLDRLIDWFPLLEWFLSHPVFDNLFLNLGL